jgi:hypothetical protein
VSAKSRERERIRELEEKLQQVKIDESSMLSFKSNVEKVKKSLKEAIIDMYAHLHLLVSYFLNAFKYQFSLNLQTLHMIDD